MKKHQRSGSASFINEGGRRWFRHRRFAVYALGVVVAGAGFCRAADSITWPPEVPMIQPQPDNVICLNAEAAAFVMTDRTGSYVMNAQSPALAIENGLIGALGNEYQFPWWRFHLATEGIYQVVANVDLSAAEACSIRLQIDGTGRGARIESEFPGSAQAAHGVQTIVMGEASFSPGEFVVKLSVTSSRMKDRLPWIRDIRLVPVDAAARKNWDKLLQVTLADPAIAALQAKLDQLTADRKQLEQKIKEAPQISQMTDYKQVIELQTMQAALKKTNGDEALLRKQVSDRKIEAASKPAQAEDGKLLEAVNSARQREQADATRDYPKIVYAVAKVNPEPPLFPTGHLDKLRPSQMPADAKAIHINVPSPVDAAARRVAFEHRNSPTSIEALCRQLNAAIRPGVAGLEKFYTLFSEQHYAEALDAYRDFFFARLKNPSAYGAGEVRFFTDFLGRTTMAFPSPNPQEVQANLQGIVSVPFEKNLVQANLGAPGTVNWAPRDLRTPEGIDDGQGSNDAYWKTPPGVDLMQKITFFRTLNTINNDTGTSPFFDLLASYLTTANKDHLRVYVEYMDDWIMNSRQDIDNCPANVRMAHELQCLRPFLAMLRTVIDERPEFAHDFPATTTARLALFITEYFHPYTIRAKRSEAANWGAMAVARNLNDTVLLNEFRAMQYNNREFERLARINFIQRLGLDGQDLEALDEGHMAIDLDMRNAVDMSLSDSPVMGKLEKTDYWDEVKVPERQILTQFSPAGNYWVPWFTSESPQTTSINGKILSRSLITEIYNEPEARRRIDGVLNLQTADRRLPSSDYQPYTSTAYLRDGFGPDCNSLYMQNYLVDSQSQGWSLNLRRGHLWGCMRTQYEVSRNNRALLTASGVIVDGMPPNRWVDSIPTGGKTDYCIQSPKNVQPGRFLAAEHLDVVETFQDAPYSNYKYAFHPDLLGLGSTTPDKPVKDVKAIRQIFHLRGQGVFLVADRILNPGPAHEYGIFYMLPTIGCPVSTKETEAEQMAQVKLLADQDYTLLSVEPAAKRVRSLSPGYDNVSLWLSGHEFEWGGVRKGNSYLPAGSVKAQDLYHEASASKDPGKTLLESVPTPLSARWKGAGNQAVVAAIVTRDAQKELKDQAVGDLADYKEISSGSTTGCMFRTSSGSQVWMQMTANAQAALVAGPAQAHAGTLLAMRKDSITEGAVLDGDSVTINGKHFAGGSSAFAFVLSADGKFEATPIQRPIDTTVISPQQTAFIEKVNVSFAIPTQETVDIQFRYTLDGTDPTLDSTLYNGPFDLSQDALVKVRPFRKGLKQTPWNIAGVDGGKTISAIFHKQTPLPTVAGGKTPGLGYQYFQGSWASLMSRSDIAPGLPVQSAGAVHALLDPADITRIRTTERAYAIKYDGYMTVPDTGVYRFFAPDPLYRMKLDAGFDLRVWVDGVEWFPNPSLHAENIWSIALEKGMHRFQVSYTDFRWKEFRNEYWMSWRADEMWKGTPVLELSGPNFEKRPIPSAWFSRDAL